MRTDSPEDPTVFRDAVGHALRFTYRNSLALIGVSLAWFVAALPVVTLGPATVGAYRAVIELREHGHVDVRSVLTTVRRQFVHAVLLGLLPLTFWGVAVLYAIDHAATGGTLTLVLLAGAFYSGLFLAMLSIPAFVALAHGQPGYDAISFGHTWLRGHITLALMTVIVTGVFVVVAGLLTIAFPVFFGGATAAFHTHVVSEADEAGKIDSAERADGFGADETEPAV